MPSVGTTDDVHRIHGVYGKIFFGKGFYEHYFLDFFLPFRFGGGGVRSIASIASLGFSGYRLIGFSFPMAAL